MLLLYLLELLLVLLRAAVYCLFGAFIQLSVPLYQAFKRTLTPDQLRKLSKLSLDFRSSLLCSLTLCVNLFFS